MDYILKYLELFNMTHYGNKLILWVVRLTLKVVEPKWILCEKCVDCVRSEIKHTSPSSHYKWIACKFSYIIDSFAIIKDMLIEFPQLVEFIEIRNVKSTFV